MDQTSDYTKYSLDELHDVYNHVNREKYPERFEAVAGEIEKRKNLVLAKNESTATINELAIMFHGSAREYFRIWIVNLCLTLLTLGIFSAWAKVRKKRYFYSHTILDGTPFQYLGRPIPILKGRMIAVVVFSVYYASTHFFSSRLPYVLIVGTVLAPWMIVRSVAFNARYSAYRNMVFHFNGKYVKVIYAGGLIPLLIIGTIFDWWGSTRIAVQAFSFFVLAFPFWIRHLKHFIFSHNSYGGRQGEFAATIGQFYKVYLKAAVFAGLLTIGIGIITAIIGWWIIPSAAKSRIYLLLFVVPIYIGYVVSYACVQAHSSNIVWNHARLGPLRFQSTLQARKMIALYVTNALAIIVSLGLLIPWAVMRTLKYRVDNLRVIRDGGLTDFVGSETSTVQAAGAEIGDFFDVDLSL
jgi:uncharacterized membrane protein YjgN (DUF898 family)